MKSKIFRDKDSDLYVEVFENGWINLYQDDVGLTLGKPPNKRTDIILKAIKYSEGLKKEAKND